MAKTKPTTSTSSTTPARKKGRAFKRNKVIRKEEFIPYSDLADETENEEAINWYQDEDAYRRISSIRPQRDWDEEDGLNIWWNWGN
ncbi:MAG: hypothetical protein N3A72_07215 [bacterium]|nr:hypothetical protein [bacterium]